MRLPGDDTDNDLIYCRSYRGGSIGRTRVPHEGEGMLAKRVAL